MQYRIRSVVNVLRRSSALLKASVAVVVIAYTAAMVPPAYSQVTESVLYSFLGGSDGGAIYAPVLAGQSGPDGALLSLYGATGSGGQMTPNCYLSCGTVFKLTQAGAARTAWNETVLANFTGGSDGDLPYAGLISHNLSLYGTTSGLSGGAGAVFKVTGHL
jgi:hypothetical protein